MLNLSLEIIAVITAILYLVLAAKEDVKCWYAAIISSSLYFYIMLNAGLLMEAILQVFYVGMAIYGWKQWNKLSNEQYEIRIKKWKKINHLGKVVINNDVEIGSNCTIDRGTLDDTIIGENVKLDDQVHIAHNCKIGKSTIMGANATIGGSTIIGKNCMIGGLCGVADNLVITDGVTVSPVSFIFKSINKAGKYSGSAPLMPRGEWLKASATYKKLSKKD